MSGSHGTFIVVEGPEWSGKSTLAAGLAERMLERGIDPVRVREPGGTAVAEAVRQALLNPDHEVDPLAEVFLFLAARADLVARVIEPGLQAGRVILADRFALSTEVYQVAGRGLDPDLVGKANRAAVGTATPSVTLVIDLPADVGLQRQHDGGLDRDRLDREDLDFHRRVAQAYVEASGPGVEHLDGTAPAATLLENAWQVLLSRCPETFGEIGSSV